MKATSSPQLEGILRPARDNIEVRGHVIAAVKGSYVRGYVHVYGYNTLATVSSGIINRGIEVGGTNTGEVGGTAVITGGDIGGAIVRTDAELTVDGGNFVQDVKVSGGKLTFDSGHAQTVTTTFGNATLNGGRVDNIFGTFRGHYVITDVTCQGFLDLESASSADLTGGSIGQVTLWNRSALNMYGGTVRGDVTLLDSAVLNRYGGTIGGGVIQDLAGTFLDDDSVLTLFGYDLADTLIDSDFENKYSMYRLSGFLSDNTNVSGELLFVENGGGARFSFVPQGGPGDGAVPEPGAATLIGISVGCCVIFITNRYRAFTLRRIWKYCEGTRNLRGAAIGPFRPGSENERRQRSP